MGTYVAPLMCLGVLLLFTGIEGYLCNINDIPHFANLDESKLAKEWYLQAIYAAPSSPRATYQDYSYSIEPAAQGLTVKVDASRIGQQGCLEQSVEQWNRKSWQSGKYTFQRCCYTNAESAIVYTDYISLLVEVVCYKPAADGTCVESEVAIYTRMRVADQADIDRGLPLAPTNCIMDGARLSRTPQDITKVPCQRKINRQCVFNNVPIDYKMAAPYDFAKRWYQVRNYPSSYRERTIFGDYTSFNCSVTALSPAKADISCPFTYRPPGQQQCIRGDLLTAYEEAYPKEFRFVDGTINANVTMKVVYFDSMHLIAFTCYKLTGAICENFAVRLFSTNPYASPEAIRRLEEYLRDPRLCADPTYYYETPNQKECYDAVYVGSSAKEYLTNLRKMKKSVPGYSSLDQHLKELLVAQTRSLKVEKEKLEVEKEKIQLEIEHMRRKLNIIG